MLSNDVAQAQVNEECDQYDRETAFKATCIGINSIQFEIDIYNQSKKNKLII